VAVPVVLAYLRRVAPLRRTTPAGFLWQSVLGPPRPVLAGGRRRWWFSLALELAIVGLLVLAVADPATRPARRIVLVLDNSLSMTATDVPGGRLEEAKRLAREMIAGLGYRETCAVVTAGGEPSPRCPLGNDPIRLRRAIDEVAPASGPDRVVEAVALARRMLATGPGGRIVVLSDGCFRGAAAMASQGDVTGVVVGTRTENVALTRLAARPQPAPPATWQALVEVANFSDRPAKRRLLAVLDGSRVAEIPLDLPAGGQTQRVLDLPSPRPGRLSVRLDPADHFVADDVRDLRFPATAEEPAEQPGPRVAPAVRPVVVAAAGVDAHQSDLRPDQTWLASSRGPLPPGGLPLWPYLAVAALLAAVVEWPAFHRRWTC